MTTHVHKVVGSNHSDIYWMDTWKFFHIVIDKNCIVCLKRPKINEKRPELAHFLLSYILHIRVEIFFSGLVISDLTQVL